MPEEKLKGRIEELIVRYHSTIEEVGSGKDARIKELERRVSELEQAMAKINRENDQLKNRIEIASIKVEGRAIRIDEEPADNGAKRTRDEWINYFNQQGKIMVSMPDLYLAGKSEDEPFLENLREKLLLGSITDTRIFYNPDNLNTKIVHHYGSIVVDPVEYDHLIVPEYNWTGLGGLLMRRDGLLLLQALFGTSDNANQIRQTLYNLSSITPEYIAVYTPKQSLRKSHPLNSPQFDYTQNLSFKHKFGIDCALWSEGKGRSCSVSIISEGTTKSETE